MGMTTITLHRFKDLPDDEQQRAFLELMERAKDEIKRESWIPPQLRTMLDSEDITDPALTRIYFGLKAGRFQDGKHFRSVVALTVRGEKLNAVERATIHSRHFVNESVLCSQRDDGDAEEMTELNDMVAPDLRTPDVWVNMQEESEQLWRAIDRLNERQRRILILKGVEGRSWSEVEQITGLTLGVARTIMHSALVSIMIKMKITK